MNDTTLRKEAAEIARFISYADRTKPDHWRIKNGTKAIQDLVERHTQEARIEAVREFAAEVKSKYRLGLEQSVGSKIEDGEKNILDHIIDQALTKKGSE